VNFTTVFKIVQQASAHASALEGGAGKLKIKCEIVAVRANEVGLDTAIITLTALGAKRSFYVVKRLGAWFAEVPAMGEWVTAEVTICRVNKV